MAGDRRATVKMPDAGFQDVESEQGCGIEAGNPGEAPIDYRMRRIRGNMRRGLLRFLCLPSGFPRG